VTSVRRGHGLPPHWTEPGPSGSVMDPLQVTAEPVRQADDCQVYPKGLQPIEN